MQEFIDRHAHLPKDELEAHVLNVERPLFVLRAGQPVTKLAALRRIAQFCIWPQVEGLGARPRRAARGAAGLDFSKLYRGNNAYGFESANVLRHCQRVAAGFGPCIKIGIASNLADRWNNLAGRLSPAGQPWTHCVALYTCRTRGEAAAWEACLMASIPNANHIRDVAGTGPPSTAEAEEWTVYLAASVDANVQHADLRTLQQRVEALEEQLRNSRRRLN